MRKIVSTILTAAALLVCFTAPAIAQESNRGFFEGDTPDGSKVLFLVDSNTSISVYVFSKGTGRSISVGAGAIQNGGFTITTTSGETITGSIMGGTITATYRGATFSAKLGDVFDATGDFSGRFKGKAKSSDGRAAIDVKIMINPAGKIFFAAKGDAGWFGGFGDLIMDTKDDGKMDTDKDSDDDEFDNRDRDGVKFQREFKGTFTIKFGDGITISGSFKFKDGSLKAKIKIDGVDFDFDGFRESENHHLANIATRGFVNTGQGQLIGGFIVRGGPKFVMIRALGPSLTSKDVSPVLTNPKLQLLQRNTDGSNSVVKENDDWNSNSNADAIRKSGVAPSDPKEAALLVRLEPGAYTSVVSGADNGTGIALVEVYEIDRD